MQKQPDLGTASVGKLLARLALPAITAQVVNMLYNLVDRIYIGHIPTVGTQALTGVGVCFPLIMLVSAFAALVYSGGAPRASIAMGKGENAEAERILGSCTALLLALSVILTVVLTIWNRPLLLLFGASEDTILYAEQYMNIYALGTLFVQAALGLNAFITCQGFAKTSMLTVLIGAVINTVLDPIFIFALDMGVQGAALATVISQGISALWVVRFLTSGKTLLRLRPHLPATELEAAGSLRGAGTFSLYYAEHGKPAGGVLQYVPAHLWRHPGRGHHDHPDQHHAVCHAAPQWPDPGLPAYYQL